MFFFFFSVGVANPTRLRDARDRVEKNREDHRERHREEILLNVAQKVSTGYCVMPVYNSISPGYIEIVVAVN